MRKKELFAKVRTGQVRVLIGSTFKMGAGMNVQDRLIALHDLDYRGDREIWNSAREESSDRETVIRKSTSTAM